MAYVSAGVYVKETDNSLYASALAPTIIGVVGTATKGPLDTPVLVTNEGQFVEAFGRPRTKDYGMHATIEALKACRLVYFVRIAGAAKTKGSVSILDAGSAATAASIGPSANAEPFNLYTGSVEAPVGTRTSSIRISYDDGAGLLVVNPAFIGIQAAVTCATPEAYNLNAIAAGADTYIDVTVNGGVKQTIVFDSADPIIVANGGYAALTAAGVAHVINDQILSGEAAYNPGTAPTVTLRSDRFGTSSSIRVTAQATLPDANTAFGFDVALHTGAGSNVADLFAVDASEVETLVEASAPADLVVDVGLTGTVTIHTLTTGAAKSIEIVSANSPAIGASPRINLTPLDAVVNGTNTGAAANTLKFEAISYGSHSSDISVRIAASTAITGCVRVDVLYRGVVMETYDKLYKSPTPVVGGYALITTINSGNSTAGYSASEWVVASDLSALGENPVVGTHTLSAGNDGDNWTAGTVVGSVTGTVRTGMQNFRDPEQIYINVLATPGISWAAVVTEGFDICGSRLDCLYVADVPQGLSPADAVKWHNGDASVTVTVDQEARTENNSTVWNSSYGAFYYPFVEIFDKYNEENIFVPPSALLLRTIAYTDEVADPWYAPAGPNRTQASSILSLEYSPTLGERDLMQLPGNNVNPIANISGVGVVIMGQKTAQKASTSLDRVNVRRLLLLAEKLVAQATFFLNFEQNDEVMWRRWINLVTPVFEDIKARRGLYDFRIIADATTTTSLLIDQNTFLGKIFLQPTKSAEKLIVDFNLVPTGVNFSEYTQA
jgi:phage tail sheath protein FI